MADLHLHERLGETRAAVVENFRLVEMHVARDGDGLVAPARVPARLVRRLGRRGIAEAEGPAGREELLVEPWPQGLAEGATTTLEITRAAWREPGRARLAKSRPTTLAPWPAPSLASALGARGHAPATGWPAELETQWADAFEAAELGRVPFETGSLVFAPTPAFTAVDVDGHGLSMTGPALVTLARTIRLWGQGGSIVIDLPAGPDRAARTAAADAFDKAMGQIAFERTAINGFGLMQIVRPRPGPSILERAQLERAATAAIALLASAVQSQGAGRLELVAGPAVARWLTARPHLVAALARQLGRLVDVATDPMAGTGHVRG